MSFVCCCEVGVLQPTAKWEGLQLVAKSGGLSLALSLPISSSLISTSSQLAQFLSCGGAQSFVWWCIVLAAGCLLRGVEEYAVGRHEAVDRLEELREHGAGIGKQSLDNLASRLGEKG